MRTISLFAIIILILSNVATAQPAPEQTWGLCIGVSEYDSDALALKWADKDATEFSTFLRYGLGIPEEHYRLLRNRDATRENILEHLGWLNIVARPGDRVYIFYSGHGKQNSPILPYDSYNLLSLERIKRALSKEEGAAAFYLPPEKIDQESTFAVVTVTVKEPSGQETVKSVAFTILPSLAPPATPLPVAPPSEEKKMSTGTITALSMGAAAALGGGIALADSGGGGDSESIDSPPATCADTWVGGYCWYLGESGQTCDSVCNSHGRYHNATKYYAGSAGTAANCERVLRVLDAPAYTIWPGVNSEDNDYGCYVWIFGSKGVTQISWSWERRETSAACLFTEARRGKRRACACAE